MNLLDNQQVAKEYDNLRLQFGNKSHLDLDDYSALFRCDRSKASRHLKMRGIPHIKVGQKILIPILEVALYLAKQTAKRENRVHVFSETIEDKKSRTGFAKMAHEKQLAGRQPAKLGGVYS